MKKQMFLSALLLAFCLAGSLTVQAHNIDPDDANLETQLYLIVIRTSTSRACPPHSITL